MPLICSQHLLDVFQILLVRVDYAFHKAKFEFKDLLFCSNRFNYLLTMKLFIQLALGTITTHLFAFFGRLSAVYSIIKPDSRPLSYALLLNITTQILDIVHLQVTGLFKFRQVEIVTVAIMYRMYLQFQSD